MLSIFANLDADCGSAFPFSAYPAKNSSGTSMIFTMEVTFAFTSNPEGQVTLQDSQ